VGYRYSTSVKAFAYRLTAIISLYRELLNSKVIPDCQSDVQHLLCETHSNLLEEHSGKVDTKWNQTQTLLPTA
jgi:hypothetical protein